MTRRTTRREPEPRRARAAAYAVSQANGVVRIVPRFFSGPGLMGRYVAIILALVAVAVIGGWVWWTEPFGTRNLDTGPPRWFVWLCPGGLFLLLAVGLLAVSVKLWWSGITPLLIDPTGRVRYGRKELIPAGSAKTVHLERTVRCVTRDGGTTFEEVQRCHVHVERTNGQFTTLPHPYFSGFDGWEVGEELAKTLAAALHVPVSAWPIVRPTLGARRDTHATND